MKKILVLFLLLFLLFPIFCGGQTLQEQLNSFFEEEEKSLDKFLSDFELDLSFYTHENVLFVEDAISTNTNDFIYNVSKLLFIIDAHREVEDMEENKYGIQKVKYYIVNLDKIILVNVNFIDKYFASQTNEKVFMINQLINENETR